MGPEVFAVLVWTVFAVGWAGVLVIAVAVIRELALLVITKRRAGGSAADTVQHRPGEEHGGERS